MADKPMKRCTTVINEPEAKKEVRSNYIPVRMAVTSHQDQLVLRLQVARPLTHCW